MSYTYLRDAGEESSAESYSAIEQSAPWRSNHTAAACYCNGSATESCHASQSGMTCEPSTELRGVESPMSSAAAFRAKTSQLLGVAQESAENGLDCGPKCAGSLARYNPQSRSWKTRQCSLFGGLESFSETWPRWGSMRSGEFWARATPERRTNGNESGCWPTPTKTIGPKQSLEAIEAAREKYRKGQSKFNPGVTLEAKVGGVPNPMFVAWLMGWPMTWTNLRPLEMGRFRKWLHSHTNC